MRYGIFSDVHSNLQAVESVRKAFAKESIDNYICVGDVVGYGANPQECIQMIKDLRASCVAGNHDWAVAGKVNIRYFNTLTKESVLWTQKHISRDHEDFLKRLPLTYENQDCLFVHGMPKQPECFYYLFDRAEARNNFPFMDRQVCFIGHSHVVGVFIQKDEAISYSSSVELTLQNDCRYIINVGSVGQPRDGNPQAAYGIFDTQQNTVQVKRIQYDIEEAQKRILEANLPSYYAGRLSIGR